MGRRRRGDRAPAAAQARSRRRRLSRRWLTVPLAGLVVAASFFAAWQTARSRTLARLPALPDLSRQPASVVDHLRSRRADAVAEPRSAAKVGAWCLALHADMFYDAAQRCYRLAQQLDGGDWRWLYYDALISGERGGGEPFADTLRRVLAKAPQLGVAWWWLGDAAFKEGRYDEAEASWRRAETAPEPEREGDAPGRTADIPLKAYASLGLARIALARGEADTARQLLERLTTEAPRFGSAFRLLAESDDVLGRPDEAALARARASRLPAYAPYADPMVDALAEESRNGTFLLRQASDADLATNAAWSEHLVRRALEFDPANPDVLAKLGRVLRNLGRNEEALEYFMAFNRRVPGDYLGLANIGTCLSDLGRPGEAERYLRRALEGIDDAETHYNLGVVLSTMGRLAEAAAEYRLALARDPFELNARNNLAVILARQGRLDEASAEWERVLTLDPGNRTARANLGTIQHPAARGR